MINYFLLYYKNAEDISALLQLSIIKIQKVKPVGLFLFFSLASNGSQPEAMLDPRDPENIKSSGYCAQDDSAISSAPTLRPEVFSSPSRHKFARRETEGRGNRHERHTT